MINEPAIGRAAACSSRPAALPQSVPLLYRAAAAITVLMTPITQPQGRRQRETTGSFAETTGCPEYASAGDRRQNGTPMCTEHIEACALCSWGSQ